jgi:hypothetical protein
MNRIAFACLWLFVFTIPWERSLQLGGGSGSVGRVAGFLALGMGLWAVGSQGRMRRLGAFHILALAFLMLVSVSFFWTADPVESPHTIRVYYQSMWVLWLIWEFAQDQQRLSQLRIAFVLGECVLVALTVQTFLNGRILDRAKEARFAAQGWDFNDMATMIALGVPFACYIALRSDRLWKRWVGWASVALAILGIVLTSSRTGLLGLAVALLTLPLLRPRFGALNKVLAVLILGVAVYSAAVWLPAQTIQRLGTTMSELTSGTMDSRTSIWRFGLLAFPGHAFFGVGAGAWQAGTGNFYTAHNTYLQILLENGLAGFTLYLLILGYAVRGIARSGWPDRLMSGVLLASFLICTIAIHWSEMPATWFILGWIVAQGDASREDDAGIIATGPSGPLAAKAEAMVSGG